MTRPFDAAARAYQSGGIWPTESSTGGAPRDIRVSRLSVKAARPLIATYHYSQSMPDATREVFAGYFPGSILAGLVVFGMGAGKNQYVRLLPDIEDGQYRELSRLWSPDGMPKNTESRLISASIRLLDPAVRLVVSYADPSQGHVGGVYQATNFLYLGMTDGGERLIDASGQEVHSKLLSVYRMRHPEMAEWSGRAIADHYGFRAIPNSAKHRYVFARNAADRRLIERLAQPYPPAVAASSDAPDDQSGEGGSQPTLPLHPLNDSRSNAGIVARHSEGTVVEPPPDPLAGHHIGLVRPGERESFPLPGSETDLRSDGKGTSAERETHIRHSGDGSGVPCRAHRPATARVTA